MSVTNYIWLGENILYETDENDAVTVEYTYEPQQYGRLLSEYRGSTTYTHYYDALGSTLALTDSTGTVTDTFAYNAWGEELARTGSTPTPFRWIGQVGYYWDVDLAGYFIRRREYECTTTRWKTIDPLPIENSLNTYNYAMNDPLNQYDPSGLMSIPGIPAIDFLPSVFYFLYGTVGCGLASVKWEASVFVDPDLENTPRIHRARCRVAFAIAGIPFESKDRGNKQIAWNFCDPKKCCDLDVGLLNFDPSRFSRIADLKAELFHICLSDPLPLRACCVKVGIVITYEASIGIGGCTRNN